jgi:hypothetical protein
MQTETLASHGIPRLFRANLPKALDPMLPPAADEELAVANAIRQRFFTENGPGAYMVDIVRAFRVLRGARTYIEVGSRDKGNVAWVSTLMEPDAHLIDVDLEDNLPGERILRSMLPARQRYTKIVGNSIGASTLNQVTVALDGVGADAIFLDSSHMYDHFMSEVDLYLPLLRPGGFLMAHDALWEGADFGKGKAQAMLMIDRVLPVYSVVMNLPVHRYMLWGTNKDMWGSVAIIIRP